MKRKEKKKKKQRETKVGFCMQGEGGSKGKQNNLKQNRWIDPDLHEQMINGWTDPSHVNGL